MRIVIIGSGPTALGAAFRLNQLITNGQLDSETQVFILEKESTVGGLARSITDRRGFTWDLGVHVTGASKYLEFTDVIDAAVGEWNNVPRCVKAFMSHVLKEKSVTRNYVPYPVQDSIPYFPYAIKQQCLEEIELLASCPPGEVNNFAAFSEQAFGKTLQTEFIRPYNEKVWTVQLEEMNCAWVEGRVPRADVAQLRGRSQMTRMQLDEEEENKKKHVFRYPKNLRGVGEMWSRVAETLPAKWFRFNANVCKIDTVEKKIHLSDGRFTDYDHVISTIPIVHLGKMSGLEPHIQLRHSKVVLVGIGLRRPQTPFTDELSWLYFPQPETTFYRCTFISNFNELMTPNAALFWSVVCEIGVAAEAEVNEQSLIENTIRDLVSHGIVSDASLVEDRWLHVLPFGYPIPTLERDQELARCHQTFHQHSIYSRGRFGSWKYEAANQDHSFAMGCQVVERILHGTEETVFS